MKVFGILALATTVFASIPSDIDIKALVETLQTALQASSPMAEAPADACWKDFGKKPDEGFAFTCPTGFEASMGYCYQPCNVGYKGFGPFCLSQQQSAGLMMQKSQEEIAATSYQREALPVESNGSCPASTFAAGDVCVQSECPAKLPVTCGVVCVKDFTTCTNYAANLTVQLVQLVSQLQSGNIIGAMQLIQKIWAMVSAWPKCSEMKQVAFQELLELVKSF